MVDEFPSLQGVMGRYYAEHDGEAAEVALGIEEHYAPRGASDQPPASPAGIVVSLADKFDAIAGCFCLGLIPTGSADPYALRRAALGILRTAIDRDLRLPIRDLFDRAVRNLPSAIDVESGDGLPPREQVADQATEFVRGRLRAMLAADFPADIADAVVAVVGADIPSALQRASVLHRMRQDADFAPLAAAYKRTENLLKKSAAEVDPATLVCEARHLVDSAERELWTDLEARTPRVAEALRSGDFERVADELIGLKPAIDRFFDEVMVMVESQEVRTNRLALLSSVRALFRSFADISRIQIEGR